MAALSQNRVQGAFSELNDNDSIEADRLRAEALALDGKHRAASELFDQIGYRQRAARENWLAEDWQALSGAPLVLSHIPSLGAITAIQPDAWMAAGGAAVSHASLGLFLVNGPTTMPPLS